MIRAVIFDMFETLVTFFESPIYFGAQIAKDVGIPVDKFNALWRPTEYARSIGEMTLEQTLEMILRENGCYSEKLLKDIVEKRVEIKFDCFRHIHPDIIPMLTKIKEKGIIIGLISNCYSEEVEAIRNSDLFPYFDAVFLSYEQGVWKPDEEIFRRCMEGLSVEAEECLYIGDGGSYELETARKLGMTALQATWYSKDEFSRLAERNEEFIQLETPMEVLRYLTENQDVGESKNARIML